MRGLLQRFLIAVLALAPVSAEAGRIYGLVIGIDDYSFVPDLHGAVNDASDIADALTELDAEVVTLLDHAASREAILAEWRRLATGLGPDDQLIVSYAGHGSNEPEHFVGSEKDGRDETLLLSGFAPYGPAAAERIRDDEIAELIALAGDGQTIFVADACHSGTLSRNLAPALGFRYVSVGKIEADPLPPPPPRTSTAEGRDVAALFIAAADDSEKTPEFLIDGRPRGALSYAFAASLRGAADADGDRVLTKGEIETYVRRKIRSVSQGSQRPQVEPAGESDRVVIALPGAPAEPSGTRPTDRGFDALPPVTLSHNGGPEADRILAPLRGVTLVANGTPADLRLDLGVGSLLSMVGDVVREIGTTPPQAMREDVQSAVDTLRLTTALTAMGSDLDVSFAGGDRTYRRDDVVSVRVTGRESAGLALLNIASDGEIAFLYPRTDLGDPAEITRDASLDLPLRVQAPFGADTVIAVETDGPAPELREMLQLLDGSHDVAGFWEGFRRFARSQRVAPRIAVFPFHTTRG
ncbi:caspase family protein [Defluviimonas sp. SAOS-178_SWC]|uniref:caspase family protein n=1 Tax=Defluviimonas sp. SAOS-178_SWC TaxID=3121287 RepID=UPI0032220D42